MDERWEGVTAREGLDRVDGLVGAWQLMDRDDGGPLRDVTLSAAVEADGDAHVYEYFYTSGTGDCVEEPILGVAMHVDLESDDGVWAFGGRAVYFYDPFNGWQFGRELHPLDVHLVDEAFVAEHLHGACSGTPKLVLSGLHADAGDALELRVALAVLCDDGSFDERIVGLWRASDPSDSP